MNATQHDDEIGAFFDRCARQKLMYDFEPGEQERLERFLAAWDVTPGCRVLEPGCGSGRLTRFLAEATGPEGEVYAVDVSPGMIQLARERGLPPHVHFVCASARAIPREDAWFDRVVCFNVFPHFTDKESALKEFARVLKPSGSLWINHLSGRDELNHFHRHAAAEVSTHTLPCQHTMKRLIQEAGLEFAGLDETNGVYSLQARKPLEGKP